MPAASADIARIMTSSPAPASTWPADPRLMRYPPTATMKTIIPVLGM
jgi:hypothetical protein